MRKCAVSVWLLPLAQSGALFLKTLTGDWLWHSQRVLPMAANATPTYASAIPMDPVDATANTNIASTSFVRGAYNAAVAVANKENERALAAEGDLTLGGTAADWNGADDLTEAVNAAMDKARAAANAAGNAVQSVAEGSTNGTVSVDGTDVAVHGLGSAAYTDSTAYDASGTAAGLVGTLSNLDTTDKSNVVAAINELAGAIDDQGDKVLKVYTTWNTDVYGEVQLGDSDPYVANPNP